MGVQEKINILVLGKTGVGKSTICNVLFNGDHNALNEPFPTCDGANRCTNNCKILETDSMRIFDTPGLMGDLGADLEIINELIDLAEYSFDYILFIIKRGTLVNDQLITQILLHDFIGKENQDNIIFVVTDCDPQNDWVKKNQDSLRGYMFDMINDDLSNILSVQFGKEKYNIDDTFKKHRNTSLDNLNNKVSKEITPVILRAHAWLRDCEDEDSLENQKSQLIDKVKEIYSPNCSLDILSLVIDML